MNWSVEMRNKVIVKHQYKIQKNIEQEDSGFYNRSRTDLCTLRWNPFNLIMCFISYAGIVYIGANLDTWVTKWNEGGIGNV
jgi:hypothetical protein